MTTRMRPQTSSAWRPRCSLRYPVNERRWRFLAREVVPRREDVDEDADRVRVDAVERRLADATERGEVRWMVGTVIKR
jgi:hypothetical protein